MKMDIRLPIGLMFLCLGLLLGGYGLATLGRPEVYQRSLQININLWWGLVMLVFGLIFSLLGLRHGRSE
jgi:hypothetical protein